MMGACFNRLLNHDADLIQNFMLLMQLNNIKEKLSSSHDKFLIICFNSTIDFSINSEKDSFCKPTIFISG
jgi:hypothetical protein